MNQAQQIGVTALCLVHLLVGCLVAHAEQPPLRVALVETGGKAAVPAELLDLLFVHLSQEENLSLLERQDIAALLQEQNRNLAFAGDKSKEDIIATGRILGADALVLLSANKPNKDGAQPVEVRIVETRRGLRFGGTVVAWSENEQEITQQVESVAEQAVRLLFRIRNAQGEYIVVSLAGFRTNEVSEDAHRVRRNLESWLEFWLASQSGIVVAERQQVLPLIEERKLSQDLPESLGEADAVVDGRFQLEFTQQDPQLQLTVRVVHKDHTFSLQEFSGPLDELSVLRKEVAAAVLMFLSPETKGIPFDYQAEAQTLFAGAERMLAVGRRGEASKLLTAAYALKPDDFRVCCMLVQTGIVTNVDTRDERYAHQYYPQALFLSDVASQVLDHLQTNLQEIDYVDRILRSVERLGYRIEVSGYGERQPTQHEKAQHEWLTSSFESLFKRYLAVAKTVGGQSYRAAVRLGLVSGHHWAKTPEDAFKQRHELLDLCFVESKGDQGFLEILTYCGQFHPDRHLPWKQVDGLSEVHKEYLKELVDSDNPFLRARGIRGLAEWVFIHGQDRDKAAELYQNFIDIVVDEIIRENPKIGYYVGGSWLDYYSLHDPFLTDEEMGTQWNRVIHACWSKGCPRSSQPWVHRITLTIEHLEKAGLLKEAELLLQECIDQLEAAESKLSSKQKRHNQWPRTAARLRILLSELVSRHPDLGSDESEVSDLAVDCQPGLTMQHLTAEIRRAEQVFIDDLQKFNPSNRRPNNTEFDRGVRFAMERFWYFLGMTQTADGYVVICGREKHTPFRDKAKRKYAQWLLVVRLNKQGQFQSAKLHPEPIERISAPVGELREHHLWPVCTAGDDLFVAGGNGLLWFPKDESPVHFSSSHMDKSDLSHRPAPFDHVQEMVALEGKLFVKGGNDPRKPKLYELDYLKSTTMEFLDAQNLPADSPFAGREGFSIMAGPAGTLLVWARPDITRKKRPPNAAGGDLFLVNMKDKSIRQSDQPLFLSFAFFQIPGDYQSFKGIAQTIGYGTRNGDLAIFNPRTVTLNWYVTSNQAKSSKAELVRAGLTANEQRMLASQKRVGNSIINDWRKYHNVIVRHGADADFHWLLYERSNPIPQRLAAANLPPAGKVKQFLMDDQNQVLMMTGKEVLRVEIPTDDADINSPMRDAS